MPVVPVAFSEENPWKTVPAGFSGHLGYILNNGTALNASTSVIRRRFADAGLPAMISIWSFEVCITSERCRKLYKLGQPY